MLSFLANLVIRIVNGSVGLTLPNIMHVGVLLGSLRRQEVLDVRIVVQVKVVTAVSSSSGSDTENNSDNDSNTDSDW